MVTIYGIANCDTVKKARKWLLDENVETRFHDFKREGVPVSELDRWIALLGWPALLNTRGTTWRRLREEQRLSVQDAASARSLMLDQPSVIKRPVVAWSESTVTVGFSPELFTKNRSQA